MEEELPSTSDVANASEDLPMCELIGLDEQLRSMEVVKKVQLEERIEKEKHKLKEIRDNPEHDDEIREDIRHRIDKLNDDLSVSRKASVSSKVD